MTRPPSPSAPSTAGLRSEGRRIYDFSEANLRHRLRPWIEEQKDETKVVLGIFDPSARPCVLLDVLTMAFPMKRFEKAVGYMEESFLITKEWAKVQKKIEQSAALHRKV